MVKSSRHVLTAAHGWFLTVALILSKRIQAKHLSFCVLSSDFLNSLNQIARRTKKIKIKHACESSSKQVNKDKWYFAFKHFQDYSYTQVVKLKIPVPLLQGQDYYHVSFKHVQALYLRLMYGYQIFPEIIWPYSRVKKCRYKRIKTVYLVNSGVFPKSSGILDLHQICK